ncbi:MAG: class I SAM-dependent methyltransferase [Acidobacteria bacterium]|nr:class I SAM-dependent methyltransferase [Acidobacteriota bacterium]
MDFRTVGHYDDNARHFFDLYQRSKSGVEKYLGLAFAPGSEVLDIGAGSGRDMVLLARAGCVPYGAEPSARLRELAALHMPDLAVRIYDASLPGLAGQIGRKFDGLLCAAVLQHLPEEQLPAAAADMGRLLRPGGRLLLSFPKDRPGIGPDRRDENGRLYTALDPEALDLLFGRHGLRRTGAWHDGDSLGRPGHTWTTLLFELSATPLSDGAGNP